MQMQKVCLICVALFLCPLTVEAETLDYTSRPTYLDLDYGVMIGGSDVLDKHISGGNPDTQYIVDAGDGEYFELHLGRFLENTPVGVEAGVGYQTGGDQPLCLFVTIFESHDPCHYDLQRVVGDVFLRYRLDDSSALVFGRTFHRNIILSSSDDANRFPNVDFGNAAGWTLEYERQFPNSPGIHWGIRYTHIVYHTVNTDAFANASSVGMYVGLGGLL